MKKNMKKLVSLLTAAAIFATSGTGVYANGVSGDSAAQTTEASEESTDSMEQATGSMERTAGSMEQAAGSTEQTAGSTAENDAGEGSETGTGQTTDAEEEATNVTTDDVEGTVTIEIEQAEEETTDEISAEVIVDENNDDVEITEDDRPYLALGADLSDAQLATVLGIMGIDSANLGDYDVVYVTNAEEHQYLDSYIDSSKIGSKALSSAVIVEREAGNGLNISTSNITYCTVGMYKNALTTAGVTDADIIVAGPTGISGTAALVGIFKAYQEMTGETIEDDVVDAALNELVITGQLEESIEGLTDEEVEEFIAYIKSVIAENSLSDEASINEAIDEACEKYGVTLSDEERQMIIDLLLKITSLGINLSGLVDYASSLYNSFKNGGSSDGIFSAIGNFFSNIFTSIGEFFKNLLSWN